MTLMKLMNADKSQRFVTIILFFTAHLSFAQTSPANHTFIFASPNTRSALTDHDAEISLTSFEQINAVAVADRLGCSFSGPVNISGVVGVFEDSSENSLIMKSRLSSSQADYVAWLFGRYAHQEFVLVFVPKPGGKDRLWTIKTAKPIDEVLAAGRAQHLSSFTVMRTGDRTELWVVDTADKLSQTLNILADKLQGTASSVSGTAEMFGDEDRLKAARLFQQKIQAFEKHIKHPLSARLWSQGWHDATQRTCSKAITE